MKFWIAPRISRGDLLFAFLGINIAYLAAQFWLTRTVDLTLNLGFRSSWTWLGTAPPSVTLLRLVADLVLAWFVLRRIRDIGGSGWWTLGLALLPFLLGAVGGLVSLAGLIALFLVRGTAGPNRFGPDPKGFRSREHFEEQQRRLRSGDF